MKALFVVEIDLYDGHTRTEYLIANIALIYNYTHSEFEREFFYYYEMNTTKFKNSNKYIIQILVSDHYYDQSDDYFTIYNENNGTHYNRS